MNRRNFMATLAALAGSAAIPFAVPTTVPEWATFTLTDTWSTDLSMVTLVATCDQTGEEVMRSEYEVTFGEPKQANDGGWSVPCSYTRREG